MKCQRALKPDLADDMHPRIAKRISINKRVEDGCTQARWRQYDKVGAIEGSGSYVSRSKMSKWKSPQYEHKGIYG